MAECSRQVNNANPCNTNSNGHHTEAYLDGMRTENFQQRIQNIPRTQHEARFGNKIITVMKI